MAATEVIFGDSSGVMYSNKMLLRQPDEATRAPFGPPFWGEPEAALVHGKTVAVYDVDPDIAAQSAARAMGVEVTTILPFDAILRKFEQVMGYLEAEIDPSVEVVDLRSSLQSLGLSLDEGVSVKIVVKKLMAMQGREASQCDRVLAGNIAAITSVTFCKASKLVVSVDKKGCVCVWDPIGSHAMLAIRDPLSRPAAIGQHPYSLVMRCDLTAEVCKLPALSDSASIDSSMLTLRVGAVKNLSVPADTPCLFL